MTKVILPELGEGIKKATISYWYFQEGQEVNQNDDLVELTTDKATFNLPCPAKGTLIKVYFDEGKTVSVGDMIAEIE